MSPEYTDIMISRNLRIALLVSLGAHVLAMSAVTIITPDDVERMRPYSRIDFLGPILRKTAFDIMLESVHPAAKTTYSYAIYGPQSGYLKVVASKRESGLREFPPYLENNMDALVFDFLRGSKVVPDIFPGFKEDGLPLSKWNDVLTEEEGERKVIYRPEPPYIMRGLYGDNITFRVRVTVLIGADGKVRKTEPLTTTGYPQIDLLVSKYVKGWIFEPKKGPAAGDEWRDVVVVLTAGY
ncbi:MAG: hypothetical protein U9R44_01230 [Candidatus Omnitrophota bacterium]|nr:hypothetical protein [Candidatus Omnitrophota bacterium]